MGIFLTASLPLFGRRGKCLQKPGKGIKDFARPENVDTLGVSPPRAPKLCLMRKIRQLPGCSEASGLEIACISSGWQGLGSIRDGY